MHKITCLLLLFFLALVVPVSGQEVDPRSVDVSSLSDQQIMKLMTEIEKRGLSENEAMALARARGMSQAQIDALKRRMEEMKYSSEDTKRASEDGELMPLEDEFSEKAEIDTTKVDERIFGFSFFNNEKLSFEPNVNLPVPSSYVIGAGDEIFIDVWGASQQSYQIEVDRNGNINIPNIGPVHVGGITQGKASKVIFDKLTLIYRDLVNEQPRTFASINMGTIKAIKVNVIGEVFAPGTYTLPGTASAFNALYLSGGPNMTGSFRDIQVIRDGKVISHLDVYDYLINGNGSVNMPLRDGDIVMIPTYINRVKVGGELKREGIYEGKDGETISDLIKYSGGFTEEAYTHRLELYRNTSRQKQFKDVLNTKFETTGLSNGDSIFVGTILERFENKITIEGAVFRPGNYEMSEGLTLKELIDNADGVREDVFLNRGLITRLNEDLTLQNISFNVGEVLRGEKDIALQREDIVMISSIYDIRELQSIKIFGEVQQPGEFDYKENMSLADLILSAGGFKESASEAFVEISRRLNREEIKNVTEKVAHVFQFTVTKDLQLSDEDKRFVLKPFDQVFIRRAPGFTEGGNVKILGEVKFAGDYSLTSKKERLSDIINRAGGLTPDAFAKGAMLTRKNKVSQTIKRLREELMEKDTSLSFSDIGFDVVGIDLEKVMKNPGNRDDVFLQPGDELVVPRGMQTVKVSGEVLNPISTAYVKGKSLKHYIDHSGGFGLQAKKSKAYVIYPNGAAASTKKFLFFNRYPDVITGSEIVVPKKPERQPMTASAWIAIAGSLASLSLTIVTLVNKM
ncbi:sugar transporter [Marinilabiliaceae bacterium JC017]|nr:sugar transporter [Marinilabiliaceae bacterium JC017]